MKKQAILVFVLLPALTLIFAVALATGYEETIPASSLAYSDSAQTVGTKQQNQEALTLTGVGISSYSSVTSTVYLPIIMKPLGLCFTDDFSDPFSGWYAGDNGDVRWSYVDGEYEILLRRVIYWAGATAVISPLSIYRVEADMRRISGSETDYGIIFDLKDWNNFYLYAIDPGTQLYGVVKIENGSVGDIVPLTNSSFINPDNNANHLAVERDGEQIDIYVNGRHLATANDVGFNGNNEVGLFAESDDSNPAAARYDDFRVWCSNPGTTTSAERQSTQVATSATAGSVFFDD